MARSPAARHRDPARDAGPWRPVQRLLPGFVLAVYAAAAGGCAAHRGPVHPGLEATAGRRDALAMSDALELLIASGQDTPADREYAYEQVWLDPQDTAADNFARAAVTGRLVQQRGLRGANIIDDVERTARRSRELDPDFRDGAATRLLGTLYVIAPATLLKHGNSEEGLELLEDLVAARPDVLENHLRLAEAYITLGDPGPAHPHLCRCLAEASSLRPDDQALLRQLVAEAGPLPCSPDGGGPKP